MSGQLIFTAIVIASKTDYRFLIEGGDILDANDKLIRYLTINRFSHTSSITSIRINPVEFDHLHQSVIQV